MWRCSICETLNDDQETRCVVCETPRSVPVDSAKPEAARGIPSRETEPPRETAMPREAEPLRESATLPETESPRETTFRLSPAPRTETDTEEFHTEAAKPRRRRKAPWILASVFTVLAAMLAGLIFAELRYQKAGELCAAGDYSAAYAIYSKQEWYRDSAERAAAVQDESYIADGLEQMAEGDYAGARSSFERAGAKAQDYIEESFYSESDALENAGNYAAARNALSGAADGPEKQAALAELYYSEAVALCNAGDYTGAQAALENAVGMEDIYGIGKKLAAASTPAPTQIPVEPDPTQPPAEETPVEPDPTAAPEISAEEIYARGIEFLDAGDAVSAQICFMQANGCFDSARRARELAYENGLSMAAGGMHCVWTEGGAVYAEGNNYFGQCNVSGWSDIVQVSAGRYHTVGLRADGTVVATGSNEWGQCRVEEWTGIVAVAAGGYHTVGLKADGTVVAVGWDAYGQCGVRSWSDVVRIAAGERHTVGVKSDGTAIAAGDNSQGQRAVSEWNDIIDVSCGRMHTVGLKSDGTLVAVGCNEYGQCDVTAIESAVAVDAGRNNTTCLTASGEIAYAGDDTCGQSQDGTPENIYALCTDGAYAMYFTADGGRALAGTYYKQLSIGENDADVALLQRVLTDAGLYSGGIDGIYDDETAQAVAGMQTALGCEATGVADPEFQTLLYAGY